MISTDRAVVMTQLAETGAPSHRRRHADCSFIPQVIAPEIQPGETSQLPHRRRRQALSALRPNGIVSKMEGGEGRALSQAVRQHFRP